jgi:glycine/D-amino acid oxidase-like deaminating enzyme
MTPAYDFVIVGGGIGGLCTAVRLASHGLRVALFEKTRLGAQASTGNHGMLHSGALYADLHPEVVPACREAVPLFLARFPGAVVSATGACYFAPGERMEHFQRLWAARGVRFRPLHPGEVDGVLDVPRLSGWGFAETDDRVVSSRAILVELARTCLAMGVELHVDTPVAGVLLEGGRAAGVRIGRDAVAARRGVVLAAGLGLAELASSARLELRGRLRSRLDLMVSCDSVGLDRSFLCLRFGGPTVAPTAAGCALASLFGASQPRVDGYRRWSVPVGRADQVSRQLQACFREEVFDLSTAQAYMCSKTEVAQGRADPGGGEPGFSVVDHGRRDGVRGLWTLVPGKMTLALHASRALVRRILGAREPLECPECAGPAAPAEALVDVPAWHRLQAVPDDEDAAAALRPERRGRRRHAAAPLPSPR